MNALLNAIIGDLAEDSIGPARANGMVNASGKMLTGELLRNKYGVVQPGSNGEKVYKFAQPMAFATERDGQPDHKASGRL